MRLIVLSVICHTAVLSAALANDVERIVYVSTAGERYVWNTTAGNVVFVAPESAPENQFLLTRDCRVQHQVLGTGSWGFDDKGWQISFELRWQVYFPGPMPPLDTTNCMMLREAGGG